MGGLSSVCTDHLHTILSAGRDFWHNICDRGGYLKDMIMSHSASHLDKAAFKSYEDVMQKIKLLNEAGGKTRISSSLSDRVQKVLGFIRQFMTSLSICIQHSPEISSLVVGGVNCVLSV